MRQDSLKGKEIETRLKSRVFHTNHVSLFSQETLPRTQQQLPTLHELRVSFCDLCLDVVEDRPLAEMTETADMGERRKRPPPLPQSVGRSVN